VIFVDDGQGHGGFPVDPGFGVQAPGARPGHDLPHAPARPDQSLPPIPTAKPSPGARPLPLPALPQGAFLVVWAPGQGWVAVPVDPNAPGVDNTLPGGPPTHPSGQPVPPTPTPQGRR
jgi:hypothetical protein